jgi:PAS domain S-box-containing protein
MPDGSRRWVGWAAVPWTDEQGRIGGMILSVEDITERLHAEAALKEGHERFEAVFRTSPIGIALGRLDDGRFVDLNPALEALLGYRRDEVLGRTAAELGLWVEPEQRAAVMQALATEGHAPVIETRLNTRGGGRVEVSFASCRVEFDGVPHFIGMASDITPQKLARRSLEQQQALLQALVAQRTADLEVANHVLAERAEAIADLYDRAPCGYFSVDSEGRISQANATVLALLGRTREQFIGHGIDEFMAPDSRALHPQRLAQFRLSGRARGLDYTFVRPDGSLLPALLDADRLLDAQGRYTS